MNPVISLKNVSKSYGATVGVASLCLQVEAGEVFGFLGPNGAGKTTTIRILLDLIRADQGEIELFGKSVKRHGPALRKRMGYLPGEFNPYMDLSSIDFLNHISRYRGTSPVLRNWLIDQLRLTVADLNRQLKYLSHGNRQKVGLVMALEHDPELVILDEPTIGLDPLIQEAFFTIVQDLQQRSRTVFLSSHILSEVEKVCSRVAIIREGRLIKLAPLSELKQKTHRRLHVLFKEIPAQGPPRLPGARLLDCNKTKCRYLIEGQIKPAIQALLQYPLIDFSLPEARLEDIFLTFYQDDQE